MLMLASSTLLIVCPTRLSSVVSPVRHVRRRLIRLRSSTRLPRRRDTTSRTTKAMKATDKRSAANKETDVCTSVLIIMVLAEAAAAIDIDIAAYIALSSMCIVHIERFEFTGSKAKRGERDEDDIEKRRAA